MSRATRKLLRGFAACGFGLGYDQRLLLFHPSSRLEQLGRADFPVRVTGAGSGAWPDDAARLLSLPRGAAVRHPRSRKPGDAAVLAEHNRPDLMMMRHMVASD
jgi:hypothetical protein